MENERRRGPPPLSSSDLDLPSRADEIDDWATIKKSFAPIMDSGRRDLYGSLLSGSLSKADEVDNWASGKKSIASPPSRYSGIGSGFRESFRSEPDSDRWARGGESRSSNGERGKLRLVLDPPKRDLGSQPEPARNRPSPFGAARPREEVLAEKGLDWRRMEMEIDIKKTGRPTSSQSSRSSSAQSSRPGSSGSQASVEGGVLKPLPKVNPFGEAKPREILLEEKGMDWRKIDLELEHRSVERPDTDEEKMLKEEIDHLKMELDKAAELNLNGDSEQNSSEQFSNLHGQLMQREKELEQLIRELDDKVRFGQRASTDMKPGSAAGRAPYAADRTPSRPGVSDDLRHTEFEGLDLEVWVIHGAGP